MAEQSDSSFIRWQEQRIRQFGFVNNLFIGLASGFLILESQSIIGQSTISQDQAPFLATSVLAVFLSVLLGGILALNRLISFRNTAQIALRRETKQRGGIDNLRRETRDIDRFSWFLLWSQTILFMFGSIFLVVVIFLGLPKG